MKIFASILAILISMSTFANTESHYEIITNNVITNELSSDATCIDEYNQRRLQLKKWLIWTPPTGVVGIPVAGVVGGFSGAAIANGVGAYGWNAIGYAIGGMMLGALSAVTTTITIETVTAVKYTKNLRMMKLISEAHQSDLNGRISNKFLRKYLRQYPNDQLDIGVLQAFVADLDFSGKLCDGSLTKTDKTSKLKHLLASKDDLFSYIHASINGAN
jgi:outer membrane lipoprotein SlyB